MQFRPGSFLAKHTACLARGAPSELIHPILHPQVDWQVRGFACIATYMSYYHCTVKVVWFVVQTYCIMEMVKISIWRKLSLH